MSLRDQVIHSNVTFQRREENKLGRKPEAKFSSKNIQQLNRQQESNSEGEDDEDEEEDKDNTMRNLFRNNVEPVRR